MKKLKFIKKEYIFTPGYRGCESVHASTLELLPDGTICAAWFGGTKEKNPDVEIWFAKRDTVGRWSYPSTVSRKDDVPKWNPVLFYNNKKLTLFYKSGFSTDSWKTYFSVSENNGETWTKARLLVTGDTNGRGPVKNKPVKLSNGVILAGASVEDSLSRWEIFVDVSEDEGQTWEKTEPLKFRKPNSDKIYSSRKELVPGENGLIQPAIWEHPSRDGNVSLFARSSFGFIYRADSKNFGKTWSEAYPIGLPNNNSGIDAVMADNGTLALVWNRVNANWGKRTPLNLSLFDDSYINIQDETELENIDGEFSYPAVISHENKLYITYTYKRKTIVFAEYEIIDE